MLETRKDQDWKPCSMGYLRGFCLTNAKFFEVIKQLESGEVQIKERKFRMMEERG